MKVTIDRVGRVVIPKRIRDSLGLAPDTELEVIPDGSGLRLEPIRRRERSVEMSDGLPILGHVDGVVLTDADVRQIRDDVQR